MKKFAPAFPAVLLVAAAFAAPAFADDAPAAADPAGAPVPAVAAENASKETDCTDHKDNDGDAVFDCGDSDCAAEPHCTPDG